MIAAALVCAGAVGRHRRHHLGSGRGAQCRQTRSGAEQSAHAEARARRKAGRPEAAQTQVEKAGSEHPRSMFENLDPRRMAGRHSRCRRSWSRSLDKAVEQLEGEVDRRPAGGGGACSDTWGMSLFGLGEPDKAIALLEKARATLPAKLGPEHPDTLVSMNSLARAYQAAGKLRLALPLFEETLKLTKAKLGPEHPDTLASMNNLALAYRAAGKLDLALPLFEETLKLMKAKLGPEHPDTLTSMNNLAGAYQAAGKLDLALPLYEETLKLRKAKLGPDHPDTLTSMNNLAVAYQAAGKLDLALPLYEETLKLRKAKLGPDHPDTLNSMNNLAAAYQAAGKLDLALPLFEETLKLRKAKLGPDHPDTLTSMNNLADAYQAAGKLDLALPLFEETLKLRKAKLGPDHPDTLNSMNNLASAYWRAKQLDKSIPLFEETLKRQEAKLGRHHPETLADRGEPGRELQGRRPPRGGLAAARRSLSGREEIPRAALGSDAALLDAYAQAGKTEQAVALAKELLADARTQLPKDSPQLAGQLAQTALLLLQAKAFTEAEPLLRECLAIREKTPARRVDDVQHEVDARRRAAWARRNTPRPSRCCWPATRG